MTFAASVGEAILLQFQAYARIALVSGDCRSGLRGRLPLARAAARLPLPPDGLPGTPPRRTRKSMAPTQHAASSWTAWRWGAACGWQRRFSRRPAACEGLPACVAATSPWAAQAMHSTHTCASVCEHTAC